MKNQTVELLTFDLKKSEMYNWVKDSATAWKNVDTTGYNREIGMDL